GNRSWYDLSACDAYSIAMDAQNALTCYTTCNGGYKLFANPVLGTAGAPSTILGQTFPPDVHLGPPFAADPNGALQALSGGIYESSPKRAGVFRSDPSTTPIQWLEVRGRLTRDEQAGSLAIAPPPPVAHILAGLRGTRRVEIGVYQGGSWTPVSANIPQDMSPNGVAFDPQDPNHCFAAFGGGSGGLVTISRDGG